MIDDRIDCWHFAKTTLRDGTPLPKAGVALPTVSDPVPCERGYHGSVRAIDALEYAPGPYVARVRLSGVVIPHGAPVDKYDASDRVGLTDYVDATEVLRLFARQRALDVIHLWDAPKIVREYLETGDESIRDAARDNAARDAAWAAWAAAWAANSAAWAANSAAWAAKAAAKAAARAAARDAQNARLEAMLNAALDAAGGEHE